MIQNKTIKCPIRHWRSKSCDQDFTDNEYRSHFIEDHDGLSYDMTVLWILEEILERVRKLDK